MLIEFSDAKRKPGDSGFNLKPRSADSIIAAGQAAWGRLNERHTWRDWKALGEALLCGRREAMRIAKAKTPFGSRYARAFSEWLEWHRFAGIAKSTRSQLLRCMENTEAVERWLETVAPAKLLRLNHPAIVLSAWRRATREPAAPVCAEAAPPAPTLVEARCLLERLSPTDLKSLIGASLHKRPDLVPAELQQRLLRQHHRRDDVARARIANCAREINALSHHAEQHVEGIRKCAAEILHAVEPMTRAKPPIATSSAPVGDLSAWPKAMCLTMAEPVTTAP